MGRDKYTVCGYLDSWAEKDCKFVMPLYSFEGKIYRAKIDEASDTVTHFLPIDVDESAYTKFRGDRSETEPGGPALYMFVFHKIVICGDWYRMCAGLLTILRYEKVSPMDMYDMYFFVGIPGKIEESVRNIIQAFEDTEIGEDNFLRPWDVRVTLDQMANRIRQFAKLLSREGLYIPIHYFPTKADEDEDLFRVGRYAIDRKDIEEHFDALLQMDRDPIYRDFVLFTFIWNRSDGYAMNSDGFRFRMKPPLAGVNEQAIEAMGLLYKNSQSAIALEKNAYEECLKLEQGLDHYQGRHPKATQKAREADAAATMEIAGRIKEPES